MKLSAATNLSLVKAANIQATTTLIHALLQSWLQLARDLGFNSEAKSGWLKHQPTTAWNILFLLPPLLFFAWNTNRKMASLAGHGNHSLWQAVHVIASACRRAQSTTHREVCRAVIQQTGRTQKGSQERFLSPPEKLLSLIVCTICRKQNFPPFQKKNRQHRYINKCWPTKDLHARFHKPNMKEWSGSLRSERASLRDAKHLAEEPRSRNEVA